jgi:hypothetical protein
VPCSSSNPFLDGCCIIEGHLIENKSKKKKEKRKKTPKARHPNKILAPDVAIKEGGIKQEQIDAYNRGDLGVRIRNKKL